MLSLNKIAEVDQLTVTALPAAKDSFTTPLEQPANLPHTYLAGASCQLTHACSQCSKHVSYTVQYGAFRIAKTWSLKRINNQKELLDEVGRLLDLKLKSHVENNIETARYYTAVLDIAMVGYYRCPHCEAQYLIGYAQRITDNEGRGVPEPDTIHVQKIVQVMFEEAELIRLLEHRDTAQHV